MVHEEFSILFRSPEDIRLCEWDECHLRSDIQIFIENDRGEMVRRRHVCGLHAVTMVTETVRKGPKAFV